MPMLDVAKVSCPYCGEPLELLVDPSAGDQQYTEDCQVCCQPMVIRVQTHAEGESGGDGPGLVSVEALREDDAV